MATDRKPAHEKKNSTSAGKFAERKTAQARTKQVWVWDVPPQPREETETQTIAAHPGIGHWERQ
jgi:hypothetical protein